MDERAWTDHPLGADAPLHANGIKIARAPSETLALISGALDQAMDALAPGAPMLALGGAEPEGPFAIRIGRDRALLVNAENTAIPGWHREGFAVSLADGLYAGLRMSGRDAADILRQGTSAPIEDGSPSAAIQFAGCAALLTGTRDGWCIRVEQPTLPYITSWLKGAIKAS